MRNTNLPGADCLGDPSVSLATWGRMDRVAAPNALVTMRRLTSRGGVHQFEGRYRRTHDRRGDL